MVVGICDDNINDRERIQNVCRHVFRKNCMEVQMIVFGDGEEFLTSEIEVDLLILDIEMPSINGIEVKEKLQSSSNAPLIIFATDHEELIRSAFGIHVYGFVVKSQLEMQLPELIQSALKIKNRFVMIEGRINSRDVVYIKAEHIYVKLCMVDGTEELIRKSLNELEEVLVDVDFIRTHRSYLVNCKWINKIGKKSMELEGIKVPIAFRLYGEVKKTYDAYCEKNARYC